MLIVGVFVIILIKKLLSLRGLLKLMRCEASVDLNSCIKGQLASKTKKTCVVFSKVQRVHLKTQKLLSAATNKIWGEHLPTFSKLAPGPFPHGKHGDMKKTGG